MRLLMTAAALLPLFAAPARADWAPTNWGMSVSDVVAVYPGTKARQRNKADDFGNYHLLATGKGRRGDFAYDVEFYFDPAEQHLAMVQLKLRNPRQCIAFLESLGIPANVDIKRRAIGPVLMTTLLWRDPPPGDQYLATSLSISEKARDFTLCWFQVEKSSAG